jgi:GPH family glycoside/pentoside/hexuronide:cation symporter
MNTGPTRIDAESAELSESGSDRSKKPYTANSGQIWAWGVGAITHHTLITTFGLATNIFILGYGMSPILVSWVMTLPRFVDGLVDPFIGHLSDDTHTRWGRRKPFMVGGSILGALMLVAMWWVRRGWNPWVQFSYLLICTTLFYICWGIYAMAWSALGFELTDDYHERSRVQGVAGLFMTALQRCSAGSAAPAVDISSSTTNNPRPACESSRLACCGNTGWPKPRRKRRCGFG